jgi:predicted acetyltransferase
MVTESLAIENFNKIKTLLQKYKKAINEESIDENQFDKLKNAIQKGTIVFYTVSEDDEIIGMCSISTIFSTYKCGLVAVFDDFFVEKEYRKKGYAKELVRFVFNDMKAKKINSVLVGCSEMDIGMYKKIGFNLEVGHLLSWDGEKDGKP